MPGDVSPFADFLDQRRKEIIAEWLRRVRRDRKIPSADDLPREELLDHLPYLLDTLIKQLRGTPVDQVNSESHGEVRWKQQYCLDELLREISVLRKVLIEELFRFYRDTKAELKLQVQASDLLHACLDLTISNSTAGFVARRYEETNDQLLKKDHQRLEMLRTITHEIANHLNVIGMRVSVLKKDRDSIDSCTESLSRSVTAMTALMKQLLEFATLDAERPRLERCEPDSLFQERRLWPRDRRAEMPSFCRTSRSYPWRGYYRSSSIASRVPQSSDERRQIHGNRRSEIHILRWAEDNWRIEVSDTGCGIAPEEQEQIFNEFYRAATFRETEPGVGLGLAITRRLVELLGGRVEVDSKLGLGSTFRVVLPRNGPATND